LDMNSFFQISTTLFENTHLCFKLGGGVVVS
jgi:hypothetical protein